jgi:uncharacterized protein (DUF2235 family)
LKPRRFVICFDGTWNAPSKTAKPTNVVNMVRAVRTRGNDGWSQIVFYDKGVGSAGGADALLGGLFGYGLTENMIDGYRFLANNFEPGDEIYVFGFSRGAYTARPRRVCRPRWPADARQSRCGPGQGYVDLS